MASKAPYYDTGTTPSSSFHEQLASMRLGSQEKLEVLHDSDSDNGVPINKIASQSNTISKPALELENQALQLQIQNLQAEVREISRLRGLRNQNRHEAHLLRREIVSLRAQLHQQQKPDILIDSDHEEHTRTQRQQTKDYRTSKKQLRAVDSRNQSLNQSRSSQSYSGANSLTKDEKEHLFNIGGCYRCHQPGRRASDKDAPCRDTPWMLKSADS